MPLFVFDFIFAANVLSLGTKFDKWIDSITDRYEKIVSDLIDKVKNEPSVDQEETFRLDRLQEKLHDNPTITCRKFLIDIINNMKRINLLEI